MKKIGSWKALEYMLDPKWSIRVVGAHLIRATKLNGLVMVGQIREEIKKGNFKSNARLTYLLKGGRDSPLIDTGQLWGSITMRQVSGSMVFVGVLRSDKGYNTAVTVHEGTNIKVTPAMRGLFFYLWQASIGAISSAKLSPRAQELYGKMSEGWRPLRTSTKSIIIPSRPFIKQAFKDKENRAIMRKNWRQAMRVAVAEVKAMGK